MKRSVPILFSISLIALCGCSTLKPTTSSPRYFLLVAAQTLEKGTATNSTQTALESRQTSTSAIVIAPIKFPEYLTKKSVALRKSANEIEYLESAVWAERLDEGFLRVLTANLAGLLPGYTVQHTRKNDVDLAIQITVQEFDLSITGEGVLTTEWRIVSPANGKTIGSGQFHFSRKGPNPTENPGGAVSTLSALIEDLSGALSKVIR